MFRQVILPLKPAIFFSSVLSCSILCIILFFPQVAKSQTTPQLTPLEINKPIEREISGVQKHDYQITLSAGQYINIKVEQRGVDVTVNLLSSGDKQIMQFDDDAKPQGQENVEFVAPAAGDYRLLVAPKYKNLAGGRYEIKLTALRPSTEKDLLQQEARDAMAESLRLDRANKFTEAFAVAERARIALEKSGESSGVFYGLILRRAGNVFFDKDDYAKAEDYFRRAAKNLEDVLGADDPLTADTFNNLAVLYNVTGRYDQSEQLFQRVLNSQEKVFGENHPKVAGTLNNLGNLYRRKGEYAKAETTHLHSLAVREKTFGPDQPEVISALMGLATVYYEKKDFVKAKAADERVLKINEKILAPDDPKLADSLNNLAVIHTELGDYATAEQMLQRALSINEKAFGSDSLKLTEELKNIGQIYTYTGDYAKSDSFYRRGLQISEKSLPENHPKIASLTVNIAANYMFQGEYAKAEPLLLRALAINEKSLGAAHPATAQTLNSLARLYEATGDVKRAVDYEMSVDKLLEQYNRLNLYAGSETQQLAYFHYLAEQTDQLISMQMHFPDNETIRRLAATAVLQRKGRVQDSLNDSLTALRRRFSEKDRKLLSDLSDTNAKLAELVLNEEQNENQSNQQKIVTLTSQKESLEGEISRISAGFYEQKTSLTLDVLQTEIPPDAVLLEFVVFRPFTLRTTKVADQYGKPRYGVYVIHQKGNINYKELGSGEEIEPLIHALKESLRDPKRTDTSRLSRAVDEKIIEPVRALLGDAKQLFISPDGELNSIPFEALVDEQGHYLVENYQVTYLTSGRDLLRMKVKRDSQSTSLIIANPQFGSPPTAQPAAGNKMRTAAVGKPKVQSVTATRSLSDTYFAPIGGTAQEARSIKTLFPDATLLSGAQATETTLKQTNAPTILHIATHGFFLEDGGAKSSAADSNTAKRAATADGNRENPLLRSGLALAGANQHGSSGDDGILTALEASGLNLWGTKLVVLSACDTGAGEIKNGEGVYGLRRAFTLAGTETLLMSLWSVSDYVTRELMTNYYKNLKAGMGRGAALRQVQLEMLKQKGREHPFYWAAFIQSGEWANLDGKR